MTSPSNGRRSQGFCDCSTLFLSHTKRNDGKGGQKLPWRLLWTIPIIKWSFQMFIITRFLKQQIYFSIIFLYIYEKRMLIILIKKLVKPNQNSKLNLKSKVKIETQIYFPQFWRKRLREKWQNWINSNFRTYWFLPNGTVQQ